MSITNVPKTDTFDAWRIKTNTIASELGDNDLLVANTTLSSTNAVNAILEVLAKEQSEVGNIGGMTTTATNLVGAVNEHDAEIGVISTLSTTAKNTLVSAINELDAEHGTLSTLTTTQKGTLVGAINELDAEHGVLSSLTTTAKNTFVAAINEVVSRESDRYANTLKLDLTHSTVGGLNSSTQSVLSNVSMPAGTTLTLGGTLDISNGTLIVGGAGGNLNIQTTFITLGDSEAAVASSGGLIISRGKASGVARPDVRMYWDESTKNWSLKKLADDNATSITPFIWDSYNIKNLVENNVESGIAVTYDAINSRMNFDVNDFTITLTGDVTGSGTVTNLGNVSINTSIPVNQIVLGTDTQGDYIATITPAVNSGLTITGNTGETAAVTVGVDSTVVRTANAQSIGGVKTFSEKPVFSSGITSGADSSFTSGTFSNNLTVQGNLTVSGTVTTVNTETINLADNILTLNSNYVGSAPTENGGIEINRGTLTKPSLYWNESTDKWVINDTASDYSLIGNVTAGSGLTGGGQGPSISIAHADTSSVANIGIDNSTGTVLQDVSFTFDTFGHVTAASFVSVDLDGRYYTETESDTLYPKKDGTGASGSWAIGITGNAATASKWATARTLSLIGDVSGSVSIDGSANVSITAVVADDSHAHSISTISNFTEEVQDIVGTMFAPTNVENGVSVYYDDTTGKINSDVNDFTISLTGDVTGSGTVSNLGNVTITTALNVDDADLVTKIKSLMPRIYNVSGVQVFPT